MLYLSNYKTHWLLEEIIKKHFLLPPLRTSSFLTSFYCGLEVIHYAFNFDPALNFNLFSKQKKQRKLSIPLLTLIWRIWNRKLRKNNEISSLLSKSNRFNVFRCIVLAPCNFKSNLYNFQDDKMYNNYIIPFET